MQLAKWLIVPSLIFLVGCTEPDAFLCTFIKKDPLEASYAFCVNAKTKEEKSVSVLDFDKTIDGSSPGKWLMSDKKSYDVFRNWYNKYCNINGGSK